VLVVSHDVVIVLLRYICEGLEEEQVLELARATPMRNAALSRLVREDDLSWSTAAYDQVTHLHEAGLDVTEHKGERHAGT
jgi:broad specificity phosphatase PhoE